MDTLVIYDQEGTIISQGQGNLYEPVGVPWMRIEVPEGKYIERIDVSEQTHKAVFADLPKSELDLLKEEQALMKQALDELIFGGV